MQSWKQQQPLTRQMYASFGLLTIWTVAGPGLAVLGLQDGNQSQWPPENAFEWICLGLATGGFSLLLVCTLWLAVKNQKAQPVRKFERIHYPPDSVKQ